MAKGLSSENNQTIFLVIDHGETDHANKCFPLVKQQAELGLVPKSDLATLQYRIMLRNGQKWQYGTQTLTIGKIINLWPVDDPTGLDEWRKAMGLQPMDENLQTVKNRYRSEVYWDKSLTVEEPQQKMVKKP